MSINHKYVCIMKIRGKEERAEHYYSVLPRYRNVACLTRMRGIRVLVFVSTPPGFQSGSGSSSIEFSGLCSSVFSQFLHIEEVSRGDQDLPRLCVLWLTEKHGFKENPSLDVIIAKA